MKTSSAFLVLALVVAAAPRAYGDSIVVNASKDNTLYAESDTLSNGAGQRMFAGKNGPGDTRRALIHFNVPQIVPVGLYDSFVTIDSVVLRLNLAQTQPGTRIVALHRVLADWGEGTSAAGGGEGGGAPATANDATWTRRFFGPALPWGTAGGDYDSTASASRSVGSTLGVYEWRSAGMTADVAAWESNPAQNFGWEIIGVESGFGTAKVFSTRNATTLVNRPSLTIYFTGPTPAGPLPPATRLFPVQPNPFNPTATIRYELARSARVTLDVYDAGGRLVRVLVQNDMPAGLHHVTWHGDDARRQRVASGVYFARLRVNNEPARVEKMVLVK